MKFIFTIALLLGVPLGQSPEHWNISNVQLIAVKEINGVNRAFVSDKSGLIEITGNVSYLPARVPGTWTPFPLIQLVGTAGPKAFSVEPAAYGMNSPTGCRYYYFTDSLANASRVPATPRLDVADGKVRFSGDSAVSLCFAFSTPPSPEMMHLEFSGESIQPQILTAPRQNIVAPPLGQYVASTPPKCTSVEPNYTDEARKAHIQGPVTLDVVIRSNGTIEVLKVLTSLGYGLDEKAIEVLTKWKCTPGTVDGKPVSVQIKIVINFRLV